MKWFTLSNWRSLRARSRGFLNTLVLAILTGTFLFPFPLSAEIELKTSKNLLVQLHTQNLDQQLARLAPARPYGELSPKQSNKFLRRQLSRFVLEQKGYSRFHEVAKDLWAAQQSPQSTKSSKANDDVLFQEFIRSVEYDVEIQAEELPNDELFSEQWALQDMGLNGIWDSTNGESPFIIAVIDSGLTLTHEDLGQNLWTNSEEIPENGIDDDGNGIVDDIHGVNFFTDNGDIHDGYGHGTKMAGIIAANTNNGIGIAGVAWKASLMPLKVIDDDGSGMMSHVIRAVDYARLNGAKIINTSFGSYSVCSLALRDALQRAKEAGILVISSSGNKGINLDRRWHSPSECPAQNLLSVSAYDRSGEASMFSNFRTGQVHIYGPGEEILSPTPHGYSPSSGTSPAAALVSGLSSLLYRGEESPSLLRSSFLRAREQQLTPPEQRIQLKAEEIRALYNGGSGSLSGQITGSETQVQGVRVRVFSNSIEIDSALTDENGEYQFSHLLPGEYEVTFSLCGASFEQEHFTQEIQVGESITLNSRVLNFGPPGLFCGQVIGPDGVGLAHRTVRAFTLTESEEVRTNEFGAFEFIGEENQDYTFSVQDNQLQTAPLFYQEQAKAHPVSLPAFLAQETFQVSGQLANRAGGVFTDVSMELQRWEKENFGKSYETETNGEGAFIFPEVLPGLYQLIITDSGKHLAEAIQFEVTNSNIDLGNLIGEQNFTVSGFIRIADPSALNISFVELSGNDYVLCGVGELEAEGAPFVCLDVPVGTYELYSFVRGWESEQQILQVSVLGADVNIGEILFVPETFSISGQVRLEDNTAVSFIKVLYRSESETAQLWTDRDGYFSFDGRAPGEEYEIEIPFLHSEIYSGQVERNDFLDIRIPPTTGEMQKHNFAIPLDVNEDGEVNERDALELFTWKLVRNRENISEISLSSLKGDISGDSEIDMEDLSFLEEFLVMNDPEFSTSGILTRILSDSSYEDLKLLIQDLDGDGIVDDEDVNRIYQHSLTHEFKSDLDFNGDQAVDHDDFSFYFNSILGRETGDATGDGRFCTSDIVSFFVAGKYESEQSASWQEGDWNGDGKFNTQDLVTILSSGVSISAGGC